MIFWSSNKQYFWICFILSLFLELGIFYKFSGLKMCLIFLILSPLNIVINKHLFRWNFFENTIASLSFFYVKLSCFIGLIFKFYPEMTSHLYFKSLFGCFFSFFIAIIIRLIFRLNLVKKSSNLVFCKESNVENCASLYPKIIGEITTDPIEASKIIEEKKIDHIFIDTLKNLCIFLNNYNKKIYEFIKTKKIQCLEVGNQSLIKVFFEQNTYKVHEEENINNFFGARILIIGNNKEIISDLIRKSHDLESASVILLTDSYEIFQFFEDTCKTIFFNKDIKLREIESKYIFDIIFDTYIIKNHNFHSYRLILSELNEIIKNKKAIVSLMKKGILFEDWILNFAKEIILKKFYDNSYGLTVISYRIHEIYDENILPNQDFFILLKDFSIQTPENISYSIWKSLWSVEKGTFNILSNVEASRNIISTDVFANLYMLQHKQNSDYEIFDDTGYDSYEILNTNFLKHKNYLNNIKVLGDKLLEKGPISHEEIAKCVFD